MLDSVFPIYVITLDRNSPRARSIKSHLDSVGVSYEFYEGVNGKNLDPKYVSEICDMEVTPHSGTIGCYLSHVRLYELILERGHPYALILEDDARVSEILLHAQKVGLQDTDFDYCFIDCDPHNSAGPVFYDKNSKAPFTDKIYSYLLSSGPQTLHAYVITAEGAARRLEAKFPIKEPVDCYFTLPYKPKFRAVVKPKLAWVSEHSLVSSTSSYENLEGVRRFRWLRRTSLYYEVRDFLKFKYVQSYKIKKKMLKDNLLSEKGRWRRLPAGREILIKE